MRVYIVFDNHDSIISEVYYYLERGQEDLVKSVFCDSRGIDEFEFDYEYSIEEYNASDLKNLL